jgi:hypothetical protein
LRPKFPFIAFRFGVFALSDFRFDLGFRFPTSAFRFLFQVSGFRFLPRRLVSAKPREVGSFTKTGLLFAFRF